MIQLIVVGELTTLSSPALVQGLEDNQSKQGFLPVLVRFRISLWQLHDSKLAGTLEPRIECQRRKSVLQITKTPKTREGESLGLAL